MDDVAKQYNGFSKTYSDNLQVQDEVGNRVFYDVLSSIDIKEKKLLDIGCGDGSDLVNFEKMGAVSFGIEPSEEFVKAAKEKSPQLNIIVGAGESLPFSDKEFDVVVSKYALQTSPNVQKILSEAARVLKSGGYFIFLSKHPVRQFLEKIETYKKPQDINYFNQKIIDSFIYEKKIHLREPSHTLSEYFSKDVFKNFDLLDFIEGSDFPASEQINGYTYPTFFVAKLLRR
ncbi:MAG: class I SAM-dependent methyltransferase [Minisyncoccia bacterium]|jgi:ubiquinone/menaquinone biosynthesis C-methylase UbiE